jgi:cyclohexadieny/prephenate dehydrogenase
VFEELTILAPGLLGASIALAVKERDLARRTVIWARRPEARLKCAEQPWCDVVKATPWEAVATADFVIVCSPVDTIYPLVKRITDSLKPGAVVTDVGSTKSLISRLCHAVMPAGKHFIGSHPMAGSDKSGMEYARASLFKGQPCFVTPLVKSDPQAVDTVLRFWRDLAMEVATISPESHDEIVANISHLPHILASALCAYLASKDSNWRNFVGAGFRDTTRIASGNPALWKSIIEQNREEIVRALSEFENHLQAIKSAVTNDQPFEILNLLERAKAYRERLRPEDGDLDPPSSSGARTS